MTPELKIKKQIILLAIADELVPADTRLEDIDIEEVFEEYNLDGGDIYYEFREGNVETGLDCEWSRHYESKSVASKMSDGSWVGWTYWYGGGKHAEPDIIDWVEGAYDLDCNEREVLTLVRTFSKVKI